ncbi:MAG TPA: hypothetical protein VG713_19200 [Pirellulales bacterium]|nr:hypothetical protein [Pirellulales bacterium]
MKTIVAAVVLGLANISVAADQPTEDEIRQAFTDAKEAHKAEIAGLMKKVSGGRASAKDKAQLKALRTAKHVDLKIDTLRIGSFGKLVGPFSLQVTGIEGDKLIAAQGPQLVPPQYIVHGVDPKSVKIGGVISDPYWYVLTIDGKTSHITPIDLSGYREKYGKL